MVERAILHLERELESKLPPQPYLTGKKKGIWCIPHGCFTQQLPRCHVHCFPPGRFLWQTRGWGGRVQLQSPSGFVHRLGVTECSFLPARNVPVSFSPMHILWDCLHTFFPLLFAQWNTHQWASNSFQLNQDRPKKSLEDRGMRWGSRWEGFFQVHLCWNVHCCWIWWWWEKEEGRRLKLQPGLNSERWLRRLGRLAESGTLCSTNTNGAKVVYIWCFGVKFIFVTARIAPFPRSFHFKLCRQGNC